RQRAAAVERLREQLFERTDEPAARPETSDRPLLVADAALRARSTLLAHAAEALGATLTTDDGDDLALALEAGLFAPDGRLTGFLTALAGASRLISADGLLTRMLRQWRPGVAVTSLGEALSTLPKVRAALGPADLYVIEARAYHADHARLVHHYQAL